MEPRAIEGTYVFFEDRAQFGHGGVCVGWGPNDGDVLAGGHDDVMSGVYIIDVLHFQTVASACVNIRFWTLKSKFLYDRLSER